MSPASVLQTTALGIGAASSLLGVGLCVVGGLLTKRSAEAAKSFAVCAGAFGMVTFGMGLLAWHYAPKVNICKTPHDLLTQIEHAILSEPSLCIWLGLGAGLVPLAGATVVYLLGESALRAR